MSASVQRRIDRAGHVTKRPRGKPNEGKRSQRPNVRQNEIAGILRAKSK